MTFEEIAAQMKEAVDGIRKAIYGVQVREYIAKAMENVVEVGKQTINAAKAAKTSETNAKASEDAAKTSETNAKGSETEAAASRDEAAISASNADQSAQEAADSLQELKDGIASGNFKGEKGDKGEIGPQGPKGEKGDKGPIGPVGPAVAVDPTLSIEGKAADAKATGDAIGELKEDVDDCVRNIIAETDRFEESVPSENQGLIEDAENVLTVHGNSETLGIPLLSDCKNQIPFPYNLNVTSSNGVTFSSYYRYLTINSSGTGTGNAYSYLTGNDQISLSETGLQAGSGYILIVQKNGASSSLVTIRIQFFDSNRLQTACHDITAEGTDTFISKSYTIPDTSVYFRIAVRIPRSAVCDNAIIYPIIIKSDAVLRKLGTESLADGARLEIPYSETAALSLVNTFNYEHSYRYKIDAKTYIDNHVSEVKMTYTTPEDFGAVGDGIADDSAAIEQCIAYGAEQQLPVRMNQTYLIASGLRIDSTADIDINRLIYTGTDTAVIVNSSSNRIHIGRLTSGGIGVTLRGESNNVEYNHISLGMVSSKSHCISLETPSKPVANNRIEFRQLKAGGDGCYCITNALLNNKYNTENTFVGGNCTYADWAFYGYGGNSKFYSINTENNIKGGYCFVNEAIATIVGDRHAESTRDGEYPYLKIKNTAINHVSMGSTLTSLIYISTIGLPINEIDVSEVNPKQVNDDGYESYLLGSSSLGKLMCGIGSYRKTGEDVSTNPQVIGQGALIWGNTLIFQGVPYKYYSVTENLDLRTIGEYTPAMPSVFEIACENCEIHLHPTYCFMGINKFEVIQTETYQAKIYDYFTDSLVFDGTLYGAGTFEISTYINGGMARLDGEGMVWSVRKIS